MHRLIRSPFTASALALTVLLGGLGCGGSKKPAGTSSDTDGGGGGDGGDELASGESKDGDGDGGTGAGAGKKDECVGFDVNNLEDMLLKSACEEANVKPDSLTPVDLKGKLEVTVSASPTKLGAGGKADLLVTYANKSKDPLILHFKINPVARFEIEVWDNPPPPPPPEAPAAPEKPSPAKKGAPPPKPPPAAKALPPPKRVDLPAGKPPAPPKGATQPPSSEPKSARITIAPNGAARVRIPWEAVKMKWAPEKFRGTPPERGFPRAAAGPLPKGKYTVKVVTPLIGVAEGVDHEMSTPKVEVEIGG